jgi:hypothetical protein
MHFPSGAPPQLSFSRVCDYHWISNEDFMSSIFSTHHLV